MAQLIANQIRRWMGRGVIAIRTISFCWTCWKGIPFDRSCHFSTAKQMKDKDLHRFFDSDMTWVERNFSSPFVWLRNDWLDFLHLSHSVNNDYLRHVFPYSKEIRSSYSASNFSHLHRQYLQRLEIIRERVNSDLKRIDRDSSLPVKWLKDERRLNWWNKDQQEN